MLHGAVKPAGLVVVLEHDGTHHGRERQGHKARHHHRARQGQRKLGKQLTRAARREGQGCIHSRQGHGHGHHGKAHFFGTFDSRMKR